MLKPPTLFTVLLLCLGATNQTNAASAQLHFWSAGKLTPVVRAVAEDQPTAEAVLMALVAGPTSEEQVSGLASAIAPGTWLQDVAFGDGQVAIDFSAEILAGGLDDARLEAIFDQVRWTLAPLGLSESILLTSGGVPLWSFLPPSPTIELPAAGKSATVTVPAVITAAGSALNGREISISPGHGLVWGGSSWNYERPVYCAPLNNEDLHNVELAALLNAFLTQDGAITRVYRCLDKNYGNYAAGKPWWTMSAGYWIKTLGYPCSVYSSLTGECTLGGGSSDGSDSLRSRPLASDYDDADIYVSIHTNGYQGDCTGSNCPNGTCTYYDSSSEHATWGTISQKLAEKVNTPMVDVIRNQYGDSSWRNRGVLNANGNQAETRIPNRAAILIELAFHDTCDRDGLYLRDAFFQSATMWAAYKGICDYFGTSPTYDLYSCEYVSDTIPARMRVGDVRQVSITLRNRGVMWQSARQFKLGAVGDSDPFTPDTRVGLPATFGTGQECTFTFTLAAPQTPGTYTSDWRMLREAVTWFGPTITKDILVKRLYARGDYDGDLDVDLEDFGHLQACFTNIGVPVTEESCANASLDGDNDVDPMDFAIFRTCLSGPGIPANVDCGD